MFIRHRTAIALATAATFAVCAPSAGALTVVDHETARSAYRFHVACGATDTDSWALPKDASKIRVFEPVVGQVVGDGFGEGEVARIQSVEVRTDGARPTVEATAVGTGDSCSLTGNGEYFPGLWDTDNVVVRATYDVVSHPKVFVNDDFSVTYARQHPSNLTANADAGWRKLRWRGWGERKTVATGQFYAVRFVPVGQTDVVERKFVYPVRVTLSRIKLCDGRYQYTRIKTAFTHGAPADVRKIAKPPAAASCLS